jgi:hypothetical protein
LHNGLAEQHYVQKWNTEARMLTVPNPTADTYPEGGEGAFGYATHDEWMGERGEWNEGNWGPLQNFYAWTWGDALFCVLDPFRYTLVGSTHVPKTAADWTLGKTQFRWLADTLEKSTAQWKVIFCHHLVGGGKIDKAGRSIHEGLEEPAYGRGSAREAARQDTEQYRIHQLMRKHGAQFFVYGHDHAFCHGVLDDVHYFCCARPTFANNWWKREGMVDSYGRVEIQPPEKPWIRALLNVLGYTRFSISPDQVTVEWVRTGYSFEHGQDSPERAQRDWNESWAGRRFDATASSVELSRPPTDVDGVYTEAGAAIDGFAARPQGTNYYAQPTPPRPEKHASPAISVSGFPESHAIADCVPDVVYAFTLERDA